MDEAVSTQAKLNQVHNCYKTFQDVDNISKENNFFYFAQLLEGARQIAPPIQSYSYCSSSMVPFILRMMHDNFQKNIKLSIGEFSKNVERFWERALQENFVFSFINITEIQVFKD